jgi:hypothetical protein
MSRRLVARSADLSRLQQEGYDLQIRANQLLIKVPYATAGRAVAYGYLASELTLSGEATTTPGNHVVFFIGETPTALPCNAEGVVLTDLINQMGPIDLGGGLVASCSFSHKPNPTYPDYYEKMSTYADMLLAYAQVLDPTATPRTFPPIRTDEDESVFRYLDAASSRARIGAVTDKLRLNKVVIIGLGGTGSYILDLVAKTPVDEIHLYDADTFLTHNAFRSPGAATADELDAAPKKVDYLQATYDAIHRHVIAHPEHVGEQNIDELRGASFVFVAIDAGPGKRLILEKLEEFRISVIDVGMGIYQVGDALGGLIRTTTSTPGQTAHVWEQVSFADQSEDDDYEQSIQIADLNMINAALAVIRWKKLFGFYTDFENEHTSVYTIDGNHLLNEDQGA